MRVKRFAPPSLKVSGKCLCCGEEMYYWAVDWYGDKVPWCGDMICRELIMEDQIGGIRGAVNAVAITLGFVAFGLTLHWVWC